MKIDVALLGLDEQAAYDAFVSSCSSSLIYHTSKYLSFLAEVLRDSRAFIFVGRREGKIVASICCMLCAGERGAVVNSLPYFGSHGDVLVADGEVNSSEVAYELLAALISFCKQRAVGAVNIVAHPLRPIIPSVHAAFQLEGWTHRIGQISLLPAVANRADADAAVLRCCTQKARNLVRKGQRKAYDIAVSNSDADWRLFVDHHRLGMVRIGGTAKSFDDFSALRRILEPVQMSRLYVARSGSEFAGALLILQYRGWIEYFTPVAVERFRSDQVLSAIIAFAMSDAMMAGVRYWNWGGTWPSQDGVYHFKKGWGAVDHPYFYYGSVMDSRLASMSPAELLRDFPGYFVRPFQVAN